MPYCAAEEFWCQLWRFQSLIAAAVTLLIGGISIFLVYRHQEYIQDKDIDERRRQLRASRAGLTLALSELTDYAEKMYRAFSDLVAQFDDHDRLPDAYTMPAFPLISDGPLNIINDCIVLADEEDAIPLSHLISFAQIQKSRSQGRIESIANSSISGRNTTQEDLLHDTLDAAILYAATIRCFAYARNETVHIHPFPPLDGLGGRALNEPHAAEKLIRAFLERHWDQAAKRFK